MRQAVTALVALTLAGVAMGAAPGEPHRASDASLRGVVLVKIDADKDNKADLRPAAALRMGVAVGDDIVAIAGVGTLGERTYRVETPSRSPKASGEYFDQGTGLAFVRVGGLTEAKDPAEAVVPFAASERPVDLGSCEVVATGPAGPIRVPWSEVGPALAETNDRRAQDRRRRNLGGAAIVDEAGGLVGIVEWRPPGQELGWIPAADVFDAAAQVKWEKPLKGAARTGRPSSVFPQLDWRTPKSKSPDDLERELVSGGKGLGKLQGRVWCTGCKGTAEKWDEDTREKVGGGGFSMRKVTCDDCNGGRLRPDAKVKRAFRDLVTAAIDSFAADLDPNLRDGFVDDVDRGFNEAVVLDRRRMRDLIQVFGRERLKPSQPQVGRAVAVWVDPDEWETKPLPGWAGDVRIIDSHDHGPLLIVDFAPGLNPGDEVSAVLLGVVAGKVTVGKKDCIVLERTVVVALDHDLEPPRLR